MLLKHVKPKKLRIVRLHESTYSSHLRNPEPAFMACDVVKMLVKAMKYSRARLLEVLHVQPNCERSINYKRDHKVYLQQMPIAT